MRLFGLIGYPLTHSFSGRYFSEKFEKEGWTDCRYELFPLSSIDDLPLLISDNPLLMGLNVTIPYKKVVIPFLDASDHLPKGVGACNCIRIVDGRLEGFNTDVIGFENSLHPLLMANHSNALILGNGGATEAVAYVLKKLGIHFEIVSRILHEGSTITYKEVGEAIIRSHQLIINTTPSGMFPMVDQCPEIPYQYIGPGHLLFDLIYNPAETLFLRKGMEQGAATKNGEEMLKIQAEESWRIWNEF